MKISASARLSCLKLQVIVSSISILAFSLAGAQAQQASPDTTVNSGFVAFEAKGAGSGAYQGTIVTSINAAGEVAGFYLDKTWLAHGFVRAANGTITEFQAPGAGTSKKLGTFPVGINDSGEVTGTYLDAQGLRHGFMWADGGKLVFSFDAPGAVFPGTWANCINAAGEVSGFFRSATGSGYHGYPALSAVDSKGEQTPLDNFTLDGIIISDNNYYATGSLKNSIVNNVKVIAWNGNNDGLEFGDHTTAHNVFVRSGDDSLKIWGCDDHITNATVWQNYNGGVVNLGWYDNSPGDYGTIDGLYVVKTDWFTPTSPTFKANDMDPVAHQNNAVIASMMVPGTEFGKVSPPVFKNIYIEDPPWVLFSLKIVPPRTTNPALDSKVNLMSTSVLKLNVEDVHTPPSTTRNSIGFQLLPPGFKFFTQAFPKSQYPDGYTLQGKMSINLTNVNIESADGTVTTLTSANAWDVGKMRTNGAEVNVQYEEQ